MSYLKARNTLLTLENGCLEYNKLVVDSGRGYVFSKELTKLLNMCPYRECEELLEHISKLESLTGVKFPLDLSMGD